MGLLIGTSAAIGVELQPAVLQGQLLSWVERGLQERSESGCSTLLVVCQHIAVARAWLGNLLVAALNRLASGVSSETPARTLAVVPESWGFRAGARFFPPVAIASLREVSRGMLSQRLPVWTSQVR